LMSRQPFTCIVRRELGHQLPSYVTCQTIVPLHLRRFPESRPSRHPSPAPPVPPDPPEAPSRPPRVREPRPPAQAPQAGACSPPSSQPSSPPCEPADSPIPLCCAPSASPIPTSPPRKSPKVSSRFCHLQKSARSPAAHPALPPAGSGFQETRPSHPE